MKDKMVDTMARLILCPGSETTDAVCKTCPCKGQEMCASMLRRTLHNAVLGVSEPAKKSLEMRITDVLHELGMPAHIKGFSYARYALSMVVQRPNLVHNITGELYPMIAKEFNTTSSRVERAIRHSIELTWDRGDMEILQGCFGYTISSTKGKPTNSEFIALLADRLRLEMKEAE